MLKGFQHAFTRQPIQGPEQHHIEATLGRVREHLGELWPVIRRAGFVIHVFAVDRPALLGCKVAELGELILDLLPFVLRGNSCVQGSRIFDVVLSGQQGRFYFYFLRFFGFGPGLSVPLNRRTFSTSASVQQ